MAYIFFFEIIKISKLSLKLKIFNFSFLLFVLLDYFALGRYSQSDKQLS